MVTIGAPAALGSVVMWERILRRVGVVHETGVIIQL